jgi:mannosyl-3-phosphoglycerate phosphatase
MKGVIITDLDGTLLDHDTYSAGPAVQVLQRAKEAGIPLCICSSKTRREIMHYRRVLGISDPFISENGGAVFIPFRYFETSVASVGTEEAFEVIELGTPYAALVAALRRVREQLRIRLRGFHEITAEELSQKSGLPIHLCEPALNREYDEAFWIEGEADIGLIEDALREQSLQVTRGSRFHHVMGNNDKGTAVEVLKNRFKHRFPGAVFAGIGDSPNDIPMLQRVDIPVLVKNPSGNYDETTQRAVQGARLADGVGPHGWSVAVDVLLSEWK